MRLSLASAAAAVVEEEAAEEMVEEQEEEKEVRKRNGGRRGRPTLALPGVCKACTRGAHRAHTAHAERRRSACATVEGKTLRLGTRIENGSNGRQPCNFPMARLGTRRAKSEK